MNGQPDMAEMSVEQTLQNRNAFKIAAMAAAAGIGTALVIVTLPHVYLETIIGATGLSEIVPAAVPPLGNTARGLIAAMAGLVSASAIYFFLNYKRGSDMGVALREQINAASPVEMDLEKDVQAKKSRFSLPKLSSKSLTKFLKKPKKDKARVMNLSDLPQLRKADSEPDAPERPSIFSASEAISPISEAIQAFEEAAPVDPVPSDLSSAPAQTFSETVPPVAAEPPVAFEPITQQPMNTPESVAEVPTEDLSEYNIAQLADRLESGLRRLKQLEAASAAAAGLSFELPVDAEPTHPVETATVVADPEKEAAIIVPPLLKEVEKSAEDIAATRQADMDAALKAALGTLEKMTAQR